VGIGQDFQSGTSYTAPDGGDLPRLEPAGPGAEPVELPAVEGEGRGLIEVLAARRSERRYSGEALTPAQLATLCWAAQGVTKVVGQHHLRAAPSAGALYAVDLYAALPGPEPQAGIYRYAPEKHKLVPVLRGEAVAALAAAALDQKFMKRSSVIFLMTAHPERSIWKYEDRSWRYFYLDAGHIGENIMLAAESLGLASCGIGAFYDTAVNQLLVLDGVEEMPLYMVAVGKPRGG
jgi:SagB-type dehydrogenase family enzyme